MKRLSKILKTAGNLLLCAVLLLGLLYAGLVKLAPATADRLFPYRGYVIKTDSMVPTIPVGSLVISKRLGANDALEPGTIITFEASRFGDKIVLTHYFRGAVMQDGALRYYTQPEGDHPYDGYVTRRGDILGAYVFHIPYVGKVMEFLQSIYGVVMMLALLLIWLMNHLLKIRSHNAPLEQVELTKLQFHPQIMECSLSGLVENHCAYPLQLVTLQITLFNIYNEKIGAFDFDPLGGKALKAGGKTAWRFHAADVPNVAAYAIDSKDITLQYTGIAVRPMKRGKRHGKK